MASNETTTTTSFGDTIGGDGSRMTSENSDQLIEPQETEMETQTSTPMLTTITTTNVSSTATAGPRTAAYRGVRFAVTAEADAEEEDDSWWWEVENENLCLDQVPNVTSVFTPSPQDIIDKPHCIEETHAVVADEDFDRLHRLADRIKSTINEQRERHLSESSDKSLTDCGKQELVQDTINSLETPKEQSLEEFKEELRVKRMARQTAVQDFRDEIASLRKQLEREREVSKRLRNGETVEEAPLDLTETPRATTIFDKLSLPSSKEDQLQGAFAILKSASSLTSTSDEDDEDPMSRSRHANIELANAQLSLQMANSENISLRGELAGVQKQVGTLKEVVACCKQMLSMKEEQCNELRLQVMHQHRDTHTTDTNCCCSCHNHNAF